MTDVISRLSFTSVILAVFLCTQPAVSQNSFTTILPGLLSASQQSVVQTPDGGFIILAGTRTHHYDENRGYGYSYDSSAIYLAKLDAHGSPLWNHRIQLGTTFAEPITLLQTSEGEFIAIANTGEEEKHRQITFIRLNLHGFVLSARNLHINETTDFQAANARLFPDGTIMIYGLAREDEYTYQSCLLKLDRDGELINSWIYPQLNTWLWPAKSRSIGSDAIALITRHRQENAATLSGVCILDHNGDVLSAMQYDFSQAFQGRYYDELSISDIHLDSDGMYTLTGYAASHGCMTSFETGFIARTDYSGNLATLQLIDSDESLVLTRILPGKTDKSIRVVGSADWENNFNIIELDDRSIPQHANLIIPAVNKTAWSNSLYGIDFPFVLPTDDEGLLISYERELSDPAQETSSSSTWGGQNESTIITRLAPDNTSCNTELQPMIVEDGGIYTEKQERELSDQPDRRELSGQPDEGSNPTSLQSASIPLAVTKVPLDVESRTVYDFKTLEVPFNAEVVCQDSPLLLSSARSRSRDGIMEPGTALDVIPNVVQSGKDIAASFRLRGNEHPEVSLVTIATGSTIRTVDPGSVQWTPGTGAGSAHVPTTDLPAGTYLLRVQSGEQQLSAKVEVR